jgi:2-methylcitrate dehydratase PrpD
MRHTQTIVQQLAGFVDELCLQRIPVAVVAEARRCVLDTFGVMVAGQRSAVARKAHTYARRVFAPGAASIVGGEQALQAVGAAYVNACAGHAYDFDDTSYTGIMHGSVVVFPAALALAQEQGATGTALLEAFVAGVEVEYAVAEYCTTHLYFKGWWTTGIYGALGAAAACSRILQLDRAGIERALSLALCNASGIKAAFGSDAKPLGVGLVASQGVAWALQAEAGLSGPLDVFENERGFLRLYNDNQQAADTDLQFFQRWRLTDPGILFKTYPVCSAAQAAIELCACLLRDHELCADQVSRIVCEVPELVRISLVYDHPESIREAQFSLPFALGCILAFGELGLEQLVEKTLTDCNLHRQMQKISMQVPAYLVEDDTLLTRCPEAAGVRLTTIDGREIEGFLGRPTGMPGNPVSDTALQGKCCRCLVYGGFTPEQATRLADAIWQLENVENCRQLAG